MAIDIQQNLMKYAEEAAYSSKGHFKTADWIKTSLVIFICLPIVLSIIIIIFSDMPQWLNRLLSCVSVISSILALISPLVSNQEMALKIINDHMALGNDYLELYKGIRNISAENSITKEQVEQISEKIKILDRRTDKLQISFAGRWWSKLKINKEMDIEWIKQ